MRIRKRVTRQYSWFKESKDYLRVENGFEDIKKNSEKIAEQIQKLDITAHLNLCSQNEWRYVYSRYGL